MINGRLPLSQRLRHVYRRRPFLALCFATGFTLTTTPGLTAEPTSGEHLTAKPLVPAPLHFGLTASTFRGVNPNDAEAALRLLAQTIGKQQGYSIATSTRIFEDTKSCETEINKGGLTLVILDALEYLSMNIPGMEPAFVHREQGVILKEFLLLVRRDSGINTLADLKDKEILLLSSRSGSLTTTWLDVLLRENGLEPSKRFFARIQSESKPSMAVLPVFFGTKPACIVDRLSFQTMVELNPQVGQKLKPLAVSEPYLDSITCIPWKIKTTQQARLDLIRSLRDLHLEPAGRQIMTLFKVDQLVPFKEEYLTEVRQLWAKAIRFGLQPPASNDSAETGVASAAVPGITAP